MQPRCDATCFPAAHAALKFHSNIQKQTFTQDLSFRKKKKKKKKRHCLPPVQQAVSKLQVKRECGVEYNKLNLCSLVKPALTSHHSQQEPGGSPQTGVLVWWLRYDTPRNWWWGLGGGMEIRSNCYQLASLLGSTWVLLWLPSKRQVKPTGQGKRGPRMEATQTLNAA